MPKPATRAIPEGYHSITPYLSIRDCGRAIEFYKRAFGAQEKFKMPGPDGRIVHAEIKIGDSTVMMGEESPEMGSRSPQTLGGTATGLMIYSDNVDTAFERAVKAGATVKMPLADMFWGDRYGKLVDPFGHEWSLGQHKLDVTPEEMRVGLQEALKNMGT